MIAKVMQKGQKCPFFHKVSLPDPLSAFFITSFLKVRLEPLLRQERGLLYGGIV